MTSDHTEFQNTRNEPLIPSQKCRSKQGMLQYDVGCTLQNVGLNIKIFKKCFGSEINKGSSFISNFFNNDDAVI